MKSTKTWMRVLGILTMVVAIVSEAWANTTTVDGITWTYIVSNGEASLGGGWAVPAVPTSTTGPIIIPSTLDGYRVTSIGDYAFFDCHGLTSVTIPDSVTSIGSNAFNDCLGLTAITLPASVKTIGEWAFAHCEGLKNVTIPSSVTRIEDYTFLCDGLTNLTMPSSVVSIGEGAFCGCYALASVTIPFGVTNIGYCSFESCDGLTSVTIPASVTSIGEKAFGGCSKLAQIQVDPGNRFFASRDDVLFSKDMKTLIRCPETKNGAYVVPDTVTHIGNNAFCDCDALTNVAISSSVKNIGDAAFAACSRLTSMVIPGSVTNVGDRAFRGCNRLKDITFTSGVTTIGESIFEMCVDLTSVTIPSSVTSIGIFIFEYCTSLKTLNVPTSWEGAGKVSQFEYWTEGCMVHYLEELGVVFDASGGVCDVSEQSYMMSLTYGWLPTPMKERHAFAGWWTAASGGTQVTASSTVTTDEVRTLYAHWTPSETKTGVPIEWLQSKAASILAANGGDFEAAASAMAANKHNTVWECYVCGLDPQDPNAAFVTGIEFSDGTMKLSRTPDLGTNRVYKLEAKTALTDAEWTDVSKTENPEKKNWNFFRVGVDLPE